MSRNFFARYYGRHLRILFIGDIYIISVGRGARTPPCDNIYQYVLPAGTVRNIQTNELRNTGMLRLRRLNRLCSSTLSVNCEKAEKDTQR